MAKSGFYQSNTVTEETTTALSSTTDFDDTGKAKSSFFATNEEYQATTDSGTAVDAAEAAQAYAEEWANKAEDSLVSAAAGGDQVDDYSALHHAAKAAADAILTAADLVLTNADVVLTGLDVVSTNADVVTTNADVVLTGLDVVATNADVVTTNADVVLTGLDVVATNADVVTTNADVVLTGLDVVATNADVVITNADVVLTNADVVLTGLDVGYAQEWATAVEDTPVSVAAGGDASTTFSALHWAAKAAATAATIGTFDSLSDVTITAVGTGELPQWNGSAWVNQTLGEVLLDNANTFTATQTFADITVTGTLTSTGTDFLIIHTATANDDHALEIVVDAAGFGDVKGLEIQYDTGPLASGEEEAAVLVNLNEVDATGGTVIGFEVLATDGGADNTWFGKIGATVGVIDHQTGTFANPVLWDNNGVDETTEVTTTGAPRSSVFVADNDYVIITSASTFGEIEIELETAASGNGIAPTFEFSTGGSGFTAFSPIDGTDGFKFSGVISWDLTDIPTWATNTSGNYEFRITRTRNTLTTTPVVDIAQVADITKLYWDKDGDLKIGPSLYVQESAAAQADIAAFGQLWVKNDTPNKLRFTDDAGTDFTIATTADLTAEDLDITGDTGTIAIDLDSEVLSFTGGTGITTTAATNDVSFAIDSTVATLTGSQTLTNKTIDLTSNTVTMTQAQLDAAVSNGNVVYTDDIGASVQAFGAVLDDFNTLGAAASDGQIIVATGAGAFAYESGATARTSLGLTIGTDVQAYDADLASWAGVTRAAGFDTFVATPSQANFMSLITDETFVVDTDIGVTVQAYDADLTTWAGLTPSANAQSLVTAANYAAMRTLLDLEAGTDFYSISAADAAFEAVDAAIVRYDTTGAFTTDQDFQAQLEISEELLIDGLISPSQITSNQNDYAPTGIGTSNVVRVDSDAARSITGLSASQAEGRVIVIQNDGSYAITFPHEDTNSTAANRFDLSNDQDFSLDAGGAALFLYDGTASRWRLIGGGGGGSVSLSDTAPASPAEGNIWVRTTDFAGFVYYNDGSSSQWVQFAGGGGGFPNVWYDNVDANTYNLTDVGDLIAGTPTALSFVNGSGTTASPAIQAIGASFGPASIGAARFTATSASGYLMFLKSRNATIGSHTIVQDGDDLGRIPFAGSDGTNFVPGAEIQAEVDGTPGTNDMPGRFVFRTTADGASTTTERIRIPSTGGISFDSGTNALDDYEEGTWTPTIEGSTTNPTVTYDTQTGNYTKVGNICTASFSVDLATYSGGSGFLWLNGLPFNSAGDQNVYGVAFTFVQNLDWGTGDTMICAHVENNDNFFYWYGQTNNSGANIVSVGDASASTTVAGTVTYRTA